MALEDAVLLLEFGADAEVGWWPKTTLHTSDMGRARVSTVLPPDSEEWEHKADRDDVVICWFQKWNDGDNVGDALVSDRKGDVIGDECRHSWLLPTEEENEGMSGYGDAVAEYWLQ
jgi:hypothetical protein